jgi:hypothetical protein
LESVTQAPLSYGPDAATVLARAAECVPAGTPPPDEIVISRASDVLFMCRISVVEDDQPYGMPVLIDEDS